MATKQKTYICRSHIDKPQGQCWLPGEEITAADVPDINWLIKSGAVEEVGRKPDEQDGRAAHEAEIQALQSTLAERNQTIAAQATELDALKSAIADKDVQIASLKDQATTKEPDASVDETPDLKAIRLASLRELPIDQVKEIARGHDISTNRNHENLIKAILAAEFPE